MKMKNRAGPRLDPWGTPEDILFITIIPKQYYTLW